MVVVARPSEELRDILFERASHRVKISKRLGIALFSVAALLVGVAVWSAVYMDSKIKTSALYGLMAAYIVLFIMIIIYTAYNSVYVGLMLFNASTATAKVRAWHKKAYKLLASTVVMEHCLFFCSLPIVIFHSLGLSLSSCLFGKASCTGISYNSWQTISSGTRSRIQQLVTRPVTVVLSTAQLAMFGCFIAALALSIVSLSVYWYGESRRRPSSDSKPISSKTNKSVISSSTRSFAMYTMIISSGLFVVFSIISLTVIRSNWFIITVVLSALCAFPLWRLRKFFREPRITRLQFRQLSQTCLWLLLLWLYVAGTGIAISLLVELPIYSVDTLSGSSSTVIIDSSSIAQLVCLLVVHLFFSAVSSVAMYIHLSLIDLLDSIVKADEFPSEKTKNPVIVEEGGSATPIQRQRSNQSWIMDDTCACCSTNRTDTVLVPCGHSVICSECARAVLGIPGFKCPICCVEVFDSYRREIIH